MIIFAEQNDPKEMECKKEENAVNCNCCVTGCARRGICCECIAKHRSKGQLPACYFPKDVEMAKDRSIEKFVQTYQERGPWW